jgi:hypothetical protein
MLFSDWPGAFSGVIQFFATNAKKVNLVSNESSDLVSSF